MIKLPKSLLASALIVGSLGLAGTASAKPFGEGPGCDREGHHHMEMGHKRGDKGFNVDRMAKQFNLTDDQRTQIEAIVEASKPQMIELGDKMKANGEQLRELTQQSPLNEAEVRRVADAQGDLKTEMIVLRAQQRAKIDAVLTDEQRAQLKEMRDKKGGYR